MEQHRLQRQRRGKAGQFGQAILLAAALLAAGCSEPQVAPHRPAPRPGQQPIAPQQAPPPSVEEAPAEHAFTYKPAGRRDPFAPIVVREEKKEDRLARPPLERYALTEFKLSGIVWGGFGYNAIIEAPDGKGYFVRTGTVMGQNRGVIRRITKDTVVVEEKFKNYLGETERKEHLIMLRKQQEGLP